MRIPVAVAVTSLVAAATVSAVAIDPSEIPSCAVRDLDQYPCLPVWSGVANSAVQTPDTVPAQDIDDSQLLHY